MMLSILLLAVLGALLLFKEWDQRSNDDHRKAYKIGFPADLDAERVNAWVRSISGTLRGRPTSIFGTPTIVFETWADNLGITHRLKVPWSHADFIVSQLRSLVPGVRVLPEDHPPVETWTVATEFALTNKSRQLRIRSAADMSTSLLAAVQPLNDGEKVIIQWTVTPSSPTHKPIYKVAQSHQLHPRMLVTDNLATRDEVNDRRDKLDEPNVLAVLRVATLAGTPPRAEHLAHRVRAALSSIHGPSTRFVKRLMRTQRLQQRIDRAAGSVVFPIQLSAPELTALIAWPIGNPFVSGLPPVMSRHLPANETIPRKGRIIGMANMPGSERKLAVSYEEARKHLHVVGPTGCLHPDTPICDPLDGTTKTVKERYQEGRSFHVFALDGEKLVIAAADPPIKFHKVGMYRLYNDEDAIVVTGQHKVWNGRAFVEVSTLDIQQGSGPVQLPYASSDDLSRLRADALNLLQTNVDSVVCCRQLCHLYDPLPLLGSGNVRAGAPLRGGVPERSHADRRRDGSVEKQVCNLPCRVDVHPSSRDSVPLGDTSLYPAPGYCSRQDICKSSLSTCLPSGPHPSCCTPVGIDLLPDEPDPHSLRSSDGLLFSNYFKNSNFRVAREQDNYYYDFHVPLHENYLACGLIHHNTGKTALLANMIKQDIEQGYGIVLIENKGDLFNTVMNYVPRSRIKDVVVMDVNDAQRPVGFNILNQGKPRVVVDELVLLFDQLYKSNGGVWTREVLYHGLRTLVLHPDLTFIDLAPLLVPMSAEETNWRDSIIRSAEDIELRNFWQRFENQPRAAQDRITQPVMDRIWQLNARPELRNIIGQSKSSFQMEDIVREGKILLVNLENLARETASLTGTLLMNSLWHAVKQVRPAKPIYLYLDEFQDFLTLPIDPEDMLAKARGYGLGMTLAHQHLAQLSSEMRQAVMANARTKIMFQSSADDARAMAREFGGSVTDADFMHLGRFEAIARISTGEGVSAPVTLTTHEPAQSYGTSGTIRSASRQAYGRPVAQVEAEILARRTSSAAKPSRKRRPKVGGDGWGQPDS